MQHVERGFVGAAVRRAPQAGDPRRDAGKRIGARRTGQPHGRGRGVLLVIGVEDENPVERLFDHRVDHIGLGRNGKGHPQEIAGIAQRVVGIDERLADRILVGHRRDCRHLGDQPVRADLAVDRIGNVGRIVIERRQRADHAAHHRHRVGIAAEPAIERRQLLVSMVWRVIVRVKFSSSALLGSSPLSSR